MNFKFYRNGTGALHNYISTHLRHDLTVLARREHIEDVVDERLPVGAADGGREP